MGLRSKEMPLNTQLRCFQCCLPRTTSLRCSKCCTCPAKRAWRCSKCCARHAKQAGGAPSAAPATQDEAAPKVINRRRTSADLYVLMMLFLMMCWWCWWWGVWMVLWWWWWWWWWWWGGGGGGGSGGDPGVMATVVNPSMRNFHSCIKWDNYGKHLVRVMHGLDESSRTTTETCTWERLQRVCIACLEMSSMGPCRKFPQSRKLWRLEANIRIYQVEVECRWL